MRLCALVVLWTLAAALTLLVTPRARAGGAPACPRAIVAWAQACASGHALKVTSVECPGALVILAAQLEDGPTLRIELSREGGGFTRVGDVGLSPVGEFGQWSAAPRALQEVFSRVQACVAEASPPSIDAPIDAPREPSSRAPPASPRPSLRAPATVASPWLLFVALALALALALRPSSRPRVVDLALALGLAASAAALAWLGWPLSFFHQNGQGPEWVEYALRGHDGLASYGPGYREIFSLAAALPRFADDGVITLQTALVATIPASAYAIARSLGARPLIAAALGLALLLDPLQPRLARGESYFATCAALLFAATAALTCLARGQTWRSPRLWLAAVVAGCVISQTARLHPITWVPSAVVPLALVAADGRLRARVAASVTAGLIIAVVVAATSLPAMLAVLAGTIGQAWMPAVGFDLQPPVAASAVIVAGAGLLMLLARDRRRAAIAAVILLLALYVGHATELVRGNFPWIRGGYLRQFAPASLAAIAAALAGAPRLGARLVALVIIALALAYRVAFGPALTVDPTDAAEARWARVWRASLPTGARVVYLGRADARVLVLPLFGDGAPVDAVGLEANELAAAWLAPGTYYYRSSLCATPEGERACATVEHDAALTPVVTRELPAVASLPWLPLAPGSIDIGLYQVGARGPTPSP
ncbi:MAG: hypothetical protein KC636_14560 [Myxococcales bacterium]|nr:hypothetical protein [Myxococcales bacterium]